jgi:superoxide dismutase
MLLVGVCNALWQPSNKYSLPCAELFTIYKNDFVNPKPLEPVSSRAKFSNSFKNILRMLVVGVCKAHSNMQKKIVTNPQKNCITKANKKTRTQGPGFPLKSSSIVSRMLLVGVCNALWQPSNKYSLPCAELFTIYKNDFVNPKPLEPVSSRAKFSNSFKNILRMLVVGVCKAHSNMQKKIVTNPQKNCITKANKKTRTQGPGFPLKSSSIVSRMLLVGVCNALWQPSNKYSLPCAELFTIYKNDFVNPKPLEPVSSRAKFSNSFKNILRMLVVGVCKAHSNMQKKIVTNPQKNCITKANKKTRTQGPGFSDNSNTNLILLY